MAQPDQSEKEIILVARLERAYEAGEELTLGDSGICAR